MSETNRVKLGIVGCGGISHAHGIAANENAEKVRFVACCDVQAERAAAWAR